MQRLLRPKTFGPVTFGNSHSVKHIVIKAAGYAFMTLTLGGGIGFTLLMEVTRLRACLAHSSIMWCMG